MIPGDADEEFRPKVDVGQDPIEWVVRIVIGCRRELGPGRLRPVLRRRHAQRFLVREMVEERTLRDPRLGAELVDGRRAGARLQSDFSG